MMTSATSYAGSTSSQTHASVDPLPNCFLVGCRSRCQTFDSPRGDAPIGGNPAGRLRGSRNKLSEEVICALLRDFRQHGQKAIAKVRRTQPAAYLKVLALLVPREHNVFGVIAS